MLNLVVFPPRLEILEDLRGRARAFDAEALCPGTYSPGNQAGRRQNQRSRLARKPGGRGVTGLAF